MPLVFRVSTRHSGSRRFVRVSVYDTVEELRDAAHRYTRQVGTYVTGEFDEAYGVTHSFQRILIGPGGEEEIPEGPTTAHIRLCQGKLGTSVVTHEATHAAMAIYDQDCLKKMGSVHEDMDREEVLCYLVGDLSARIVNLLYKYGCYDDVEM